MESLTVALNGLEVGTLNRRSSGSLTFQYLNSWLERAGARAVSLSLPLNEKRYEGAKVYNFFDNLLPDSDQLRNRIQSRLQTKTKQPFDLLSSAGQDCIGAIQIYPAGTAIPDIRQVRAQPLSDQAIGELLSNYQTAPLGMAADSDFRISLAGAQEKTALLWHENQWKLPEGPTPTSHIFKLPIGFLEHSRIDLRQSSENEWLCLQILKAFGLPVANAELTQFGGQTILVVERFDRRWSSDGSWLMRLPQEDFCQALGVASALKYESDGGPGISHCMKLLEGSQQVALDRQRFFSAQIVFWLLAAIDGHAKNFSLFLEAESGYRMTPLYDVISAYPLFAQGSIAPQRAKMAMAVHGKRKHYHWSGIYPRHFLNTASKSGFSKKQAAGLMQDLAQQANNVILTVESQLPADFPAAISQPILEGLQTKAEELLSTL